MMTFRELLLKKQSLGIQLEELEAQTRPLRAPIVAELEDVEKRINAHLAGPVAEAYKAAGTDTGTVKLEIDSVSVRATRDKSVKWDQDALQAIAGRISAAADNPYAYIDVELKVPERRFNGWPEPVQRVFMAARTVKPGPLKFEFTFDAQEEPDTPGDDEIPF